MIDLSCLNKAQRESVEHMNGAAAVIAGPGSGKTRVITMRVARLLERGVDPSRIAVLTFTRKAAEELRTRVRDLIGDKALELKCGTFHSIALQLLRVLRPYWDFKVIDDSEARSLFSDIAQWQGVDVRGRDIVTDISYLKAWMLSPEKMKALASSELETKLATVYENYEKVLADHNMVDFDNIIWNLIKAASDKETAEKLACMFDYILVDEYQDTNFMQSEFLSLLLKKHNNIFVVGDPNQAIFGFRGASPVAFDSFFEEHPRAKVFALDINYRSTEEIVKGSSYLVKSNISRRISSFRSARGKGGSNFKLYQVPTNEAAAVKIAESVDMNRSSAVLVRTNQQMSGVLGVFDELDVPYKIVEETSRTLSFNGNCGSAPVSVLTMHAAKGLEFDDVFIVGFEEGLIPHSLSVDEDDINEERRLLYVALTRAKDSVSLFKRTDKEISRFSYEIPMKFWTVV